MHVEQLSLPNDMIWRDGCVSWRLGADGGTRTLADILDAAHYDGLRCRGILREIGRAHV